LAEVASKPETAEGAREPFETKVGHQTAELPKQQQTAARLDAAIAANIKELGYGG
jgi:type I restriction enzyme M protein